MLFSFLVCDRPVVSYCECNAQFPACTSNEGVLGPRPGTGAPPPCLPSGQASRRAAFIWAGPREKGHVEMEIPEAAALTRKSEIRMGRRQEEEEGGGGGGRSER